ncbi:site-specific integrase [Microbacterium istanbulense]|uniref:Site-specific integrase n=1 Tax=Microbacterium istanbulense TaxID=3122049 RepID=A0ABU8LMN3_9MICO
MRDTKPRTRVLPSGRRQVRVWDAEQSKYVSLGTYATEDEATMAALKFQAGVFEEPQKSAPKPPPQGREKFGRFALEVIESKKHVWAPSTYHAHVRNLDKHLKTFRGTPLGDITYSSVVKWWKKMDGQPIARKQSYATMRMVMSRAVRLGRISTSPCMIEGATKDFSTKRPTFHAEDVRMMILMTGDLQMEVALLTMLGTGIRIGELLALDWQDIDLSKGKITVRRHLTPYGLEEGTKHHADGKRVLMMPQEVTDALLRLAKSTVPIPDHPVFVNAWGRRMTYKAFSYTFKPLRASCALDALRPHDIRHIHLSEYARHSTLREVMDRAGHTDVSSSLRYQHADEERERQIVDSLKL